MFKKKVSAVLVAALLCNSVACSPTQVSQSAENSASKLSPTDIAYLDSTAARESMCTRALDALGRSDRNLCSVPSALLQEVVRPLGGNLGGVSP